MGQGDAFATAALRAYDEIRMTYANWQLGFERSQDEMEKLEGKMEEINDEDSHDAQGHEGPSKQAIGYSVTALVSSLVLLQANPTKASNSSLFPSLSLVYKPWSPLKVTLSSLSIICISYCSSWPKRKQSPCLSPYLTASDNKCSRLDGAGRHVRQRIKCTNVQWFREEGKCPSKFFVRADSKYRPGKYAAGIGISCSTLADKRFCTERPMRIRAGKRTLIPKPR